MNLSLDAIACIMLILQKSMIEEKDVTELFEAIELTQGEDGKLYVTNQEDFSVDIDLIYKDLEEVVGEDSKFEFLE